MGFLRTILSSLLLCIFAVPVCTQEYSEGTMLFERQVTRAILSAKRTPGSSIVFRLRTFQTSFDKGNKERIVIRFINDSVFEQKMLLSKSHYVIRNNSILDYDLETGKAAQPAYVLPEPVDSSGYSVLAFKIYPDDTVYCSYFRTRFDSLHRLSEKYSAFGSRKPERETWTYEGDSVIVHTRYELVQDTFHIKSQDHTVRYANPDSSYLLRTYSYTRWNGSEYVRTGKKSETTRLVYDSTGRAIRVEINERVYGFGAYSASEMYHTMEVEYHEK